MKSNFTDKQFIDAWNKFKSTTEVAKDLKISESNVRARRRRVEKKYMITLPTFDNLHRKIYDQTMLITADRVEVKLQIKDGIILVAGDQHYWPESIPLMHKAFVYLAKKIKPFAIIWNGDAFDGSSISRFPSIGWESKPSVAEEIEAVQDRSREILKASPNSKRVWTAGNHDLRMESRIAANLPELRNLKGVHLKDHIPEWTPAWFVTVNEGKQSHTEIRHRESGGVHAGYNNTLKSGVNIVTGHDHRADVVAYDDRRGRRYAVRHGMTADSSRDPQFVNYLEGKKTNWQSAFAVLTYKNGTLLQPELALKFDEDSFEFRGEVIPV
jgi:DNA-binding Lrp family transcriptional regulator